MGVDKREEKKDWWTRYTGRIGGQDILLKIKEEWWTRKSSGHEKLLKIKIMN